jgi:hypothetical protein
MRIVNKVVALLLPLCLVSLPALAQQTRVVDSSTMSQALADKAGSEDAQRQLVRRVLDRADVREMAARMGLSLEQADSAVAQHATAVEAAALAGGANTIVISTVSLLLIIIIVILLAK